MKDKLKIALIASVSTLFVVSLSLGFFLVGKLAYDANEKADQSIATTQSIVDFLNKQISAQAKEAPATPKTEEKK